MYLVSRALREVFSAAVQVTDVEREILVAVMAMEGLVGKLMIMVVTVVDIVITSLQVESLVDLRLLPLVPLARALTVFLAAATAAIFLVSSAA